MNKTKTEAKYRMKNYKPNQNTYQTHRINVCQAHHRRSDIRLGRIGKKHTISFQQSGILIISAWSVSYPVPESIEAKLFIFVKLVKQKVKLVWLNSLALAFFSFAYKTLFSAIHCEIKAYLYSPSRGTFEHAFGTGSVLFLLS